MVDCPLVEGMEPEHEEPLSPRSVEEPLSPRLIDSTELDLTIGPMSSDMRPGPQRLLAEDPLLASSMDASSWDGVDATLVGSIDAASDPLGMLSLSNLSTMADENSIWDQMWSVFGNGPSDSLFEDSGQFGQSVEYLPLTTPWLKKLQPAHNKCGRRGANESASKSLPGAHRPLKPKALEAVAKRSLGELTPLHVNGIDRFFEKEPLRSSFLRKAPKSSNRG